MCRQQLSVAFGEFCSCLSCFGYYIITNKICDIPFWRQGGQNERSDQNSQLYPYRNQTESEIVRGIFRNRPGMRRICACEICDGGTASPAEDRRGLIGAGWGRTAWIFIGAAGIAVRYIAPFVKDKFTDSPVLVLDEKGEYVIPILSGHVGGAAALADEVAELLGAAAVHTTATDVQGKFAVDVFAKKNHLLLTDRSLAKEISAAVLEGERIALYIEETDCTVQGSVPDPVVLCAARGEAERYRLRIVIAGRFAGDDGKKEGTLLLRPRNIIAGIGCRKGIGAELLENGLRDVLQANGLKPEQVRMLASIDLKKEEPALLALSGKYQIPFVTYSADELRRIPLVSAGSDFVKRVTGVDNVCERAAVLSCENGELIQKKCVREAMTAALVGCPVVIRF